MVPHKQKVQRTLKAALAAAVLLSTSLGLSGCMPGTKEKELEYSISSDTYYDKTLAGILGQVGGVLTGYEFVSEDPLPDDWFGFVKGPYSGESDWVQQPENDRILDNQGGAIGSDDDYHIDFFNQLLLDKYGPRISSQAIKNEWVAHEVSDWGGGFGAMANMTKLDMLPPMTGKSEYNPFYWVTEAYIENDTLGMVAPGMPVTAAALTEKFAAVSGDFDSITWAKLQGAMYSLAYVENDARVILDQAAALLPEDSWPYQVYKKVKELHEQNPMDWRWAQAKLREVKRMVYGWDNIQVIPDINNALAMLSIVYGNNDYTESARIASLSGYDADCTASFVMGLMGIINGMEGTPQALKDTIYKEGKGMYVNDFDFTPHIGADYPDEQKFTDIAKLYVRNAERMIKEKGGHIENSVYSIHAEHLYAPAAIHVPNSDFEQGNSLGGWTVWAPKDITKHVYAEQSDAAMSGNWMGRVDVDGQVSEGKLSIKLSRLHKGATYRVKAYMTAEDGVEARLFADEYGGPYIYSSLTNRTGNYASRVLDFEANGSKAIIGLHALQVNKGKGSTFIDNVTVEQIEPSDKQVFEAERLAGVDKEAMKADHASGKTFIRLKGDQETVLTLANIKVDLSGEYALRVYYANGGISDSHLDLQLEEHSHASIWLPQTGKAGIFSRNYAELPIELKAGTNQIQLKHPEGAGDVDIDYFTIIPFEKTVYSKGD